MSHIWHEREKREKNRKEPPLWRTSAQPPPHRCLPLSVSYPTGIRTHHRLGSTPFSLCLTRVVALPPPSARALLFCALVISLGVLSILADRHPNPHILHPPSPIPQTPSLTSLAPVSPPVPCFRCPRRLPYALCPFAHRLQPWRARLARRGRTVAVLGLCPAVEPRQGELGPHGHAHGAAVGPGRDCEVWRRPDACHHHR